MNFAYASNAIAGFFVDQLSFTGTPWDRFLAGDNRALSDRQMAGAQQFLSLKCSVCHTGPTLSDRQFHDVAVAQIGPGEGNGPSGRDDFGRFNVTNDPADLYRFRTSPLRNVELTGPYGHDGSIVDLRAFIEHYSESDKQLLAYNPLQLEPLLRGTLLNTSAAILAQRDTLLNGVVIPSAIVDQLTDYMSALTDDAARDLHRLVPHHVPSGLRVDR
jgi:cytochrome c peroxidase